MILFSRQPPLSSLVLLSLALSLSACFNNNNQAEAASASTTTTVSTPKTGQIQNISNAELQQLIDQGVTVVDIRRPEEWQQTGIVEGSKTLTLFDGNGNPLPSFFQQIKTIAPPDQPVALICRTGNRTQAGAQMLARDGGYSQVYNVTRGITSWIGEGRPVVKP